MKPDYEIFIERITICISEAGNLTRFSKQVNMSYTTINRWFKQHSIPTRRTLIYLANRLNKPISWFYGKDISYEEECNK